jgi:hypothetical protein
VIPATANAVYAVRRVMSVVILVMTVSVSSSAAGRPGPQHPAGLAALLLIRVCC